MNAFALQLFLLLALGVIPVRAASFQTNSIEGWTTLVNERLLVEDKAATERALELLRTQLREIVRVVPPEAVVKLREVTLWFSPEYPGVKPTAEYHPDAGWLREHGRNPAMARGIEFTNVRIFEAESRRMPNFTLHELAHAYHHRTLSSGFDNTEIKAAYDHAKASGSYDQVDRSSGDGRPNTRERAYAMTNPMEYFAESTEAFFSRNDFFPFIRAELKQHDPAMEQLLARLWGLTTAGGILPIARADKNSQIAHEQLLAKAKRGRIDVYFVGDSITRRWGATDPQYRPLLQNWITNFFGWNAANFGWGADKIENILWRLENGELDGVNPKIIVVLAGINNVGQDPGGPEKPSLIADGIKAIVQACKKKAPAATIILTAILPRNDNMAVIPVISEVNRQIAKFSDGKTIRFVDINRKIADANGQFFKDMVNPDNLHPAIMTYQIWADALKPIFTEILGPPAATDLAPSPTGDPSAESKK